MRIGIDARFYGSLGKGLGRYTQKLIEHLERIDHDNEYIIFLRRENFEEYQPHNPHFKKVLAHYAWYGLSEQTFFLWRLYRARLDLVHFPHFNVPFFYTKKFIVTIHDLILLQYPTLRNTTRGAFLYTLKFLAYRLVIAAAIKRAEHIITVSHFTERDILTHYPFAAGKISVIYEAADPFCQLLPAPVMYAIFHTLNLLKVPGAKEHPGPLHDILRPYLLYVGNAYPHKNLEIILEVAQRMPQYTFVLVGKDDYFYSRLKQAAEKQNSTNVIFSGFVDDATLSVLYRFARLYIFPSLYEGFGLPPLEALAHGLPVLASDRGSLPEILGDAAVYFQPRDTGSLQKEIVRVQGDAMLRATLQTRGYERVAQFSFESMAQHTARLYQQTLLPKTKK